jgi:hypothetical protein
MSYFDIIFQTLIDIIIFDNLLLTFYFISFIFLIYLLSNQIQIFNNKSRIILLFRFIIVLLVIPLFSNKIFKEEIELFRPQKIGIMIDNSMSINNILNEKSIDIFKYLNKIDNWANDKNINLTWYDLDKKINLNNLSFNNSTTSYEYLKDISINKDVDQLLLISDGLINSGYSSNNFFNEDNIVIHTIGIGDKNFNQDIGIIDFKTDPLLDSVRFSVSFTINSIEDNNFICNIFSDKILIHNDTINVVKGQYNIDKNILVHSRNVGNKLTCSITPLDFLDTKLHNNFWNMNLYNDQKKTILMLTGKLTYNTMFIKSNISDIANIDLDHHIISNENFDYSSVINNQYDYFIFDNFPNDENGYQFYKKINNKELGIMFVEGVGYEINFLKLILEDYQLGKFELEQNFKGKSLIFDNNIDLGYTESTSHLFCYNCPKVEENNLFSDGSIAEMSILNLHSFLIPNLSEISFFMNIKYGINYLNEYFKYVINKKINNKSLLKLQLNKNNYSIGEKLIFKIDNNLPIELKSKKILINDLSSSRIDTIDYTKNNNLYFEKDGKYEIYFSYTGTNSEVINSNKETFVVNQHNIELEGKAQDIEVLNNISLNSRGYYIDLDDFNIDYLKKINSDSIKENIKNIYTALDIFIRDKIFLLIIMLFCVEIYLRKKIGLL